MTLPRRLDRDRPVQVGKRRLAVSSSACSISGSSVAAVPTTLTGTTATNREHRPLCVDRDQVRGVFERFLAGGGTRRPVRVGAQHAVGRHATRRVGGHGTMTIAPFIPTS
jgi:hypothetical protein